MAYTETFTLITKQSWVSCATWVTTESSLPLFPSGSWRSRRTWKTVGPSPARVPNFTLINQRESLISGEKIKYPSLLLCTIFCEVYVIHLIRNIKLFTVMRVPYCNKPAVYLSVLASHHSQDLLGDQWYLLVQLALEHQEDQGNLFDPSVHGQVDLYLPSNPSDQGCLCKFTKLKIH